MTENISNDDKIESADYSRREFLALAGMGVVVAGATVTVARPIVTDMTGDANQPVMPPSGKETWTASVCQICPAGCGIEVRRIDDRVVKVEGNPQHRLGHGKVCPKAHAGTEVLYDPDRLQGPKKRTGDKWEDITWEEAIAALAEKLDELQANGEAHSMLFLKGNAPGQMSGLIDRFCTAYGTPNVTGDDSRCMGAEQAANWLTRGWRDSSAYDWEKGNQIIFFGGSFLEDWQPQLQIHSAYSFIRRGRHERGHIVQVGSRHSVSTNKADEWVPIKPGTEGALALGLIYVIIKENQHDHIFIEEHTTGFEEFAEMGLNEYSPETVSGLTGVPIETIYRLARELAGNRPSIAAAGQGLGIGTNAMYAVTAINALNAVLGSIDTEGGVLRQRYPAFTEWPAAAKLEMPRLDGAGGPEYPLAQSALGSLPGHILGDDPYPVKALFMYDANPVFDNMGAGRWKEALEKIPFVVSFSSFIDESAEYADLLLPDHTYLERMADVIPPAGMGQAMVGIGDAVIPPLYNTRHTGDVLLQVAQKLGGNTAEALPWKTFENVLKYRFEGVYAADKGSIQANSFDEFWAELLKRGVWEGTRYPYEQWDEALTTPSGTFEFKMTQLAATFNALTNSETEEEAVLSARSADLLAAHGVLAAPEMALLPHFEPPAVAGDANKFPLQLVPYLVLPYAGHRAPNSPRLWNIYGVLAREAWGNWAGLNTETARQFGINDNDTILVESPEGKIQLKARIFEGAMPDTVAIPLGGGHTAGGRWGSLIRGANPAEIVVPQSDPLAGSAAWLGTRVKVSNISKA